MVKSFIRIHIFFFDLNNFNMKTLNLYKNYFILDA